MKGFPRACATASPLDLLGIRADLFAEEDGKERRQRAVRSLRSLATRGRALPLLAELSGQLVEWELSPARCDTLRGALLLTRFVNGVIDPLQTNYSESMHEKAAEIGFPLHLVDVRHMATHGELPSVALLETARSLALRWVRGYYWDSLSPSVLVGEGRVRADERLAAFVREIAASPPMHTAALTLPMSVLVRHKAVLAAISAGRPPFDDADSGEEMLHVRLLHACLALLAEPPPKCNERAVAALFAWCLDLAVKPGAATELSCAELDVLLPAIVRGVRALPEPPNTPGVQSARAALLQYLTERHAERCAALDAASPLPQDAPEWMQCTDWVPVLLGEPPVGG